METDLTSATALRWYIGGFEIFSLPEAERQAVALETRLTAIK